MITINSFSFRERRVGRSWQRFFFLFTSYHIDRCTDYGRIQKTLSQTAHIYFLGKYFSSYRKITFLNSLKRWQMGKIAVFLRESFNARFGGQGGG